jgi:hypothetical protein
MSDDKKPDPIDDLRKGLGLLFRAAKSAVDQLPKDKFEEAVLTGAREVGRAIENVTEQIEKQVFNRDKPSAPPVASASKDDAAKADAKTDASAPEEAKHEEPKNAGDDEPKGPRVA